MAQLLLQEDCTVTITHSKTKDLKAECLEADIIVAAVGIPELVKADWVKKDSIVIDVGINKTEKGIVGDVAFDEVSKVASALTPVGHKGSELHRQRKTLHSIGCSIRLPDQHVSVCWVAGPFISADPPWIPT
jgi:hypothetical protein